MAGHYNYTRLTALDNSFLVLEDADRHTPMHVASVALFEAGPLRRPDGGIDFERIVGHIAARLHRIPRYRQRLAYIPIEARPVWVDDERFNLLYHVRHTALPKPGAIRQLKRMAARVMEQRLDRGKPLWETWIVEGVEGDLLAMISKVHHCMIDGVSGSDLLTVLLDPTPETPDEEPVKWVPRPVPDGATLLRDELLERVQVPVRAVSRFLEDPVAFLGEVRDNLRAIRDTARGAMEPASDTPFNQPVGPHRRFDWTQVAIADIRRIRERLGGSLNDVVLATVAGAVRRFLQQRSIDVDDLRFKVFCPVSTRSEDERGKLGNRVAGWVVPLPIAERDPEKRYAEIVATTSQLKQSGQARGSELFMEVAEWTGSTVLAVGARLAARAHPVNMVVTNVPGPRHPLYLLGARMVEAYPMVPLGLNMTLGIALFSNVDRLFWGFNADWDLIPDLHDFVTAVETSFAELLGPPGVATTAPQPAEPSRPGSARGGARRRAGGKTPQPRAGGNGSVATA